MKGFHVDRLNRLSEGQVLGLQRVMPAPLDVPMLPWFDEIAIGGELSGFGVAQLCERGFINPDGGTDQEIELVFELVRALYTPERPSRLRCIFAVSTLPEAQQLVDEWAPELGARAAVWAVEAPAGFRADSEHLDLGGTAWDVLCRARRYWLGEPTDKPRWELLLEPPAIVGQLVTPRVP